MMEELMDIGHDEDPFLTGLFTRYAYYILTGAHLQPAEARPGEPWNLRDDFDIQPDDHRAYFFLRRDLWLHERNPILGDGFHTKVALEPWMSGQDILNELTGEDAPEPGAYRILFVPARTENSELIKGIICIEGSDLDLPALLKEDFGIRPNEPVGGRNIHVNQQNLEII